MFEKLIEWSRQHYHHLPWRKRRTLYTTFVSEIMLQQTTVATVMNHFERFIKQYPDLASLANSSEEDLLIAWKGLGYYRRAKSLRLAAQDILTRHQGRFPMQKDELLKIHGIGPYTASAIMAIGRDQRDLAIDANLERVVARLYGVKSVKGPKLQKEIAELFENKKIFKKTDHLSFRQINEALMDLGRSLCQANKVRCEVCFLRQDCQAYLSGDPLSFPQKNEKKAKKISSYHDLSLVRLIISKNQMIAAVKKKKTQWLAGQYELPTFVLSSQDNQLSQYPKASLQLQKLLRDKGGETFKSAITKYRITNHLVELDHSTLKDVGIDLDIEWLNKKNLEKLSVSSLKALKMKKTDINA